jgi:hypothetical protein
MLIYQKVARRKREGKARMMQFPRPRNRLNHKFGVVTNALSFGGLCQAVINLLQTFECKGGELGVQSLLDSETLCHP